MKGLRNLTLATAALAALAISTPVLAHEDPGDDGLIDGGGSSKTDCVARFQTGLELNYPPPDTFDIDPKPSKELACVDGDIACDSDGLVNGSCTFNVGLCLSDDQDLDECTPGAMPPGSVVISNKKGDPELAALQASVDALIGAGMPCDNPGAGGGNCFQCTAGQTSIVVPLSEKKGRDKIIVKATTSPLPSNGKPVKDSDKLKLRCLPCGSNSAFEHINKIIFQASCTTSSCHGGNAPQAGMQLDSNLIGLDGVYNELITEDPTTGTAHALGLRRIDPSDPDLEGVSNSLMVAKLRLKPNQLNATYCAPNSQPDGCVGGEMPPGVDTYSTGKVDLLKKWIAAGAPTTGWPAGTSCGDPEDIYTPAVPLDPPAPGEGFQMHFVPPPGFIVEPGTEYEGCEWMAMPPEVTETMYITRVQIRMNPGSHHMLAYQDIPDSGPDAVVTPFDDDDLACNKRYGLKRQFVGSQDPEFDQTTPDNVAMVLAPGQVFGINTHYTNPYNVPIHPEVWINFYGSTTPSIKEQKSIFPGDTSFSIPPYTKGEGNLITFTHSGPAGCYFGLSSHSHRRNTGIKIWTTQPSSWDDADGLIYYNPDWDHPLSYVPDPRLLMQTGDKFWFQCQWDNGFSNPNDVTRRCRPPGGPSCALLNSNVCVTNADCGPATSGICDDCALDFGPLAEDEMCFIPGVYYDADPGPDPCPY